MKTIILCISIVLIHTCVSAQNWDIHLTNGKEIAGVTPAGVTSDSVLFRSGDGASGGVTLSEVRDVSYREKESKAGQDAMIGILSGAALGYVTGLIADGNGDKDQEDRHFKVILPVVCGATGGIIGYAVGAGGGERTVDVSSLSNEEKSAALSKLLSQPVSSRKQPAAAPATAGTPSQDDVLYLKNGSIIHGSVVELIPDSTVKIVTTDGSVFVFRSSEVDKLVKRPPAAVAEQPKPAPVRSGIPEGVDRSHSREARPLRFGLHFGVAFPTGEFASTTSSTGGAAKAGIMFGGEVEYRFSQSGSYLGSVFVALNSPDVNTEGAQADIDQWTTVWPMVGMRYYPLMNSSVEFYLQGKVGILFGTYPGMNVSSGDLSVSEPSAGASSVAYLVGGGFVINQKVNIGLDYLYGNPEYELRAVWTRAGSSTVQSGKIRQSTGIVQLTAGVIF